MLLSDEKIRLIAAAERLQRVVMQTLHPERVFGVTNVSENWDAALRGWAWNARLCATSFLKDDVIFARFGGNKTSQAHQPLDYSLARLHNKG
jgi:hypothetical protein